MNVLVLGAIIVSSALVATAALATPVYAPDDQGAYTHAKLIGDRLRDADSGNVQIVYLHGMRAEGAGASSDLRKALEREFNVSAVSNRARCFIDLGSWPEAASYNGQQIWRSKEEWLASRPFVDTYEYSIGGKTVDVSELNWWPLLHPLKCRFLIDPETRLSGRDNAHIDLCASGSATGRSDANGCDEGAPEHFPWFTAADVKRLRSAVRPGGRGAWPNGVVKRQVMNWGLSDAVIALGTMRPYLTYAVDKAFERLPDSSKDAKTKIAISESLGSYVLMDAARDGSAAAEFVDETADFYFFANQFALLELARIENLGSPPKLRQGEALGGGRPEPSESSPLSKLLRPRLERLVQKPRQIIAFHDPSDALTYLVPKDPDSGVTVINVYVKESGGPFRLFAHPIKAHRGAISDKSIWDRLLKDRRKGR